MSQSDDTVRVDDKGNFYVPMNCLVAQTFPDEVIVTHRGQDFVYYLERRLYLPNTKKQVLLDTIVGVRYTSARWMAEFAEEMNDEK